ncbi:MAG TPA: GNAT family N-acetyltransferase [Pirellulales bacterium]
MTTAVAAAPNPAATRTRSAQGVGSQTGAGGPSGVSSPSSGVAEFPQLSRAARRAEKRKTPPLALYDAGARVAVGSAGDHPGVQQLLTSIFQGPSRDEFSGLLDDPFYEPRHRLLVQRGDQTVSHLLLSKRVMQFGSLSFPTDCLSWLGTLPEFREHGFASRLLRAAEESMQRDGAVLGVLKTSIPHFFRRFGWALCGRHSQGQAGSRDLLAQLSAGGLIPGQASVGIRPWRQVELPALMRLYNQRMAGRAGHVERTEAYWRWLVSRKCFERLYVAVDGHDNFELEDDPAKIVGYLIMREDRVLELVAGNSHPHVARELLARACSEAIERDYHMVTLHAPADDPLLAIFEVAGGTLQSGEWRQGEVYMTRLMNPTGFLKMLCPELHLRAERARLTRPCELGLLVDGEKYRLIVSRRSVKLSRNKIGRSYLACTLANFTRLVMGHFDIDEAIAAGRLRSSTQLAAETARVLFPQLPLWRPPLDEVGT